MDFSVVFRLRSGEIVTLSLPYVLASFFNIVGVTYLMIVPLR